jgi:hypothetical protein
MNESKLIRVLCAAICAVFFAVVVSQQVVAQATPGASLDSLISSAQKGGDSKSVTRLTNLKFGLARLKPSDLKDIQCGKGSKQLAINVDQAEDLAGKLLEGALKKYLPTLAAALASAPAAGVAAFLTSTPIGSDAVEILNQSDKRPIAEVQGAARLMLQDTSTENFKKLGRPMMAKITGCAI